MQSGRKFQKGGDNFGSIERINRISEFRQFYHYYKEECRVYGMTSGMTVLTIFSGQEG